MKRKLLLGLGAVPFVAVMGAVPVAGCNVVGDAACPEYAADYGASLGADIDLNVKTFMQAAGTFSELADEMVLKVSTACGNIAVAAGRDKSAWEGKEGDALVKAACNEADAGINAVLDASGDISIELGVEGGGCEVSVKATSECYAKCDVSGQCTPAQLEAHCEPGKLAGKCTGECSGRCEGGNVVCKGTCDATCTGTCSEKCIGKCDGTESNAKCMGMCTGQCTGSCDGTCSGQCDVQKVTCSGTCHGECSVEFQEPYCEGHFDPPECNLDADCKANCEASVEAEAKCTPPKVTYKVVGTANADLTALATAMEANLPEILLYAEERGTLIKETGTTLIDSGNRIASEATLSAKAVACVGVAAAAAASASVKVEASVSVSATVYSSASSRSK